MTKTMSEIIDSMPYPIAIADIGKISIVNRKLARMLGYKNSIELNQAIDTLSLLLNARDGEIIKLRHNKGHYIYVFPSFIKLNDDKANPKKNPIMICLQVIDGEKKTPNKFLNLQSIDSVARSRFLAAMSHEMLTPLNSLLNISDILCEHNIDSEQKELLEVLKSSAQTLFNRIDDVLSYAEIYDSKIQTELSEFNPFKSIEHFIDIWDKQIASKNIDLELEFDDRINTTFIGDAIKFAKIIQRLTDNAIKYTYEGKVIIEIHPGEDGHGIFIKIEDTGIGIETERLKTIFEPFNFDIDPVKRAEGGLSIGLSLCKKLARSVGGELNITSNVGLGTSIIVYLPFERAAIVDTDHVSDEPKNLRILVAEDNRANQRVINLILEKFGFEVVCVNNGQECLKVMEIDKFDMILMDLHMPVMDGYEATRRLRENNHNLPIVALTADTRADAKLESINSGMTGFLTKPIIASALLEMIKTQTEAYESKIIQFQKKFV